MRNTIRSGTVSTVSNNWQLAISNSTSFAHRYHPSAIYRKLVREMYGVGRDEQDDQISKRLIIIHAAQMA